MSREARLGYAALVLSAVSLGVAIYIAFSPSRTARTDCDCNTTDLRAALAAMERRVEVAEARGAVRRFSDAASDEPRVPVAADDPDEADEADSDGPSRAPGGEASSPTRYTAFEVPNSGVSVSQSESGALSVNNTDPTLTGEVIVVRGLTADGRSEDITLTVPSPE